jgi:hypothetical protein
VPKLSRGNDSAAELLNKDEARLIPANIAGLSELLRQLTNFSEV